MSHAEFHKAVKIENVEKIQQLIVTKELDLDIIDNHGYTALHNAVMNQNEEMVSVLLELPEESATTRAANPNIRDKAQNGWTPLIHAISNIPANSNHKILYLLVSHGADINISGKDDLAPLHWAIELDQTSTIEFLLAHKADMEKRGPMGDTPLIMAARSDKINCFEFLLNRKANLLAYNQDRENALHVAIDEKNSQMVSFILDFLKEKAAEDSSMVSSLVNSLDSHGNTPAHVAASRGLSVVADAVMKIPGFDTELTNNDGHSVAEVKKDFSQRRAEEAQRLQKEKEDHRQSSRSRKTETKRAEKEQWEEEEKSFQREKQAVVEDITKPAPKGNGWLVMGIFVAIFIGIYGFLLVVTREEERQIL